MDGGVGGGRDIEQQQHQLASLGLPRVLTEILFEDQEGLAAELEPLRSQGTRDENRERYESNRRSQARAILTRSAGLICALLILLLSWVTFGIYFYYTGWSVWLDNRGKPCDQPLAMWLLVTLVMPLLSCVAQYFTVEGSRFLLEVSQLPVLISGIVPFYHVKTCQASNPVLYAFVKNYLLFLSVNWALRVILPLVIVFVAIYGMRSGWFDEVRGACPETIKNLETVAYDPSLFAEEGRSDDNRPAPECCCCTEAFGEDKNIKRTPCQHYFHEECLAQWLKVSTTCPLCRNDLQEMYDLGV